ncbi:MAG: AAA family ATPase [Desulfobacterales bacterium]|nr:AAA family ATPase [Desulfobacterales bacterium]
MTTEYSNIIRFFKTCYQADNREQTIWNIFSRKHEFLKVLTGEDADRLLEGGRIELPEKYGESLASAAGAYRREKTLLLGGMFVAGRISGISTFSKGSKKICAPLLLFEADLESKGKTRSLSVDPGGRRWNTSLLAMLLENRDDIHDLETSFTGDDFRAFDLEALGAWMRAREGQNRIVRVEEPFADETALKRLSGRRKGSGLVLTNGAAMLLAARSRASRGIIDELDVISGKGEYSRPLVSLFSQQTVSCEYTRPEQTENVPGILSGAQETALKNAARRTLSLLIGPPGTGKSYTIACMALERFLAGESVLVVSGNEHAVDVIQEKLVEQLGVSANAVLRAGGRDHHKRLVSYIDNLTKGIGVEEPGKSFKKELRTARKEIGALERRFTAVSKKAVSDGLYLDAALTRDRPGWIQRVRIWLQKRGEKKYGLLHEQLNRIQAAYKRREALLARHINRIHMAHVFDALARHRSDLVSFLRGLRARTSSRQEKMFLEMDHAILLKAMPIWLCSLPALSRSIPLKKELFDLVIMDEATQCDFASGIPALFRARRAVVAGDPKQLRHVSFLSRRKQEEIRRKLQLEAPAIELNFRDNSMIDFADQAIASQDAVTMLDEHYRSLPEIIRFSNHRFYDDRLRIMTEKPLQASSRPVDVIYVSKGRRVKGVNSAEAEAVVSRLKALVASQEKIPRQFKVSIGVLSFFRDQAEELQKRILDAFSLEAITAHRLRAGTPYAFQGEERDVMLISSAVDSKEKGGTWRYLNRPDVFNVAITRARRAQYLFLSMKETDPPPNTLMRDYLKSIRAGRAAHVLVAPSRDVNIDALAKELRGRGMDATRDFTVAGIPMDVVATFGSRAIAVDVIGFPGEYQDVFHLDRYKIFERAGLTIFPLSYTSWIYNREAVLQTIQDQFKALAHAEPALTITADSLTSHWHKLLAVNPDLAKKVRALEFSLAAAGLEKAVDQTGRLIERYRKFTWLLGEKLHPGELTWSRYISAAEQVLLGGLDNLNRIVLLKKSMPGLGMGRERGEEAAADARLSRAFEKQARAVDRLLASNEAAIEKLEAITLEWSGVDTGGGEASMPLEESLAEMERLIENVKKYAG